MTVPGLLDDPSADRPPHDRIVSFDAGGTALFVASALAATIVFDDLTRWVAAVTALGLFAVGVFAFLWGYATSVQRSRTEEISVAELYLLVGPATPRAVKWRMNALLAIQGVVAVTTALIRSSTDGEPGSSLAFGVLVPMFGLGLNGLWAARRATFGPRRRRSAVPPADPEMEQNAPHG